MKLREAMSHMFTMRSNEEKGMSIYRKLIALSSTIMILIAGLGLVTAQESVDQAGDFEPHDCPFPIPGDFEEGDDVYCGTVIVPQSHEEFAFGTFEIGVSVFKSTSANPAPDPLLMNTGGPGGSTAIQITPLLTSSLGEQVLQERDIVLMEVRGSQYTNPYLFCDPLFENLRLNSDAQIIIEAAQSCQVDWESQGIRLDTFNSLEIVSDMVMTIDALGYETFNYYGVSYGTTFGQHLLRDYPERVRAVVFDAVSPRNR